jgi:hypothetical protein
MKLASKRIDIAEFRNVMVVFHCLALWKYSNRWKSVLMSGRGLFCWFSLVSISIVNEIGMQSRYHGASRFGLRIDLLFQCSCHSISRLAA